MNNLKIESWDTPPQGWSQYVENHPEGKLYHLPEWNDVVNRSLGRSARYITLKRADKICGVLPLTEFTSKIFGRFAVSQPFINYGGPLLDDDSLLAPLAEYLAGVRKENDYKHVELRMDRQYETALPVKQHKVTFFMDLPEDPDELMKSFKSKLRSQIKRPIKEEMTAKSGGLDLLDTFYHVFTVNMRELGTPPLPKSFFREILKQFPDLATIVAVFTKSGEAAAASFLIKYRDIVEIPWASSIRKFNRFSPNMLLYWESFRTSIENGGKVFDFGRCSPEGGTYRFKKQWKSREHPLFWYYVLPNGEDLPELNPDNAKFSLAIKTWTKLPLSVTKIVGPQIIKNIP